MNQEATLLNEGGCGAMILSNRNINNFLTVTKGRFLRPASKRVSKIYGQCLLKEKKSKKWAIPKWKSPPGVSSEKSPSLPGQ